MSNTTFGKRTAAGLALAAALVAGPALAQSSGGPSVFQRASGTVSQDLSLRDNFNFGGSGFQWNTTSRLSLTLRAENSRSQFSATSGTGFRLTDQGNGSIIDPALGLRFATGTKRFKINATANYSDREIRFDEVQPDLSTVTLSGDREQLRLSFGLDTALTQTTNLSIAGNYGTVSFSPASTALVANDTYGLSATVGHQVSPNTRVSFSGGLSYFEPDNGLDARTATFGAGLNHALDSTTTVNANFGVALSETDLSAGGSRSDNNFTYRFGVSRQLASGSISASFNQQIVPSASGALQVNTGLRAGFSEQINQRERFGLNASYDIQEGLSGGGSSTFLSVTPNYSVQLGKNVAASAAYSLQRNDSGDIAQSLNFSLSRDFNLPF